MLKGECADCYLEFAGAVEFAKEDGLDYVQEAQPQTMKLLECMRQHKYYKDVLAQFTAEEGDDE